MELGHQIDLTDEIKKTYQNLILVSKDSYKCELTWCPWESRGQTWGGGDCPRSRPWTGWSASCREFPGGCGAGAPHHTQKSKQNQGTALKYITSMADYRGENMQSTINDEADQEKRILVTTPPTGLLHQGYGARAGPWLFWVIWSRSREFATAPAPDQT